MNVELTSFCVQLQIGSTNKEFLQSENFTSLGFIFFHQESSGSARTDYRAIQLAKKRKQKGNGSSTGEKPFILFSFLYTIQGFGIEMGASI